MTAILLSLVLAFTPGCQVETAHGIPVRGVASWYDATFHPKGTQSTWYTRKGMILYAAVGTFRWGDKPYGLKVCRADDRDTCVQVTVVDYCGRCHKDLKRPWTSRSRNIDLSPYAFSRLRGLQFGVLQVILTEYNPDAR